MAARRRECENSSYVLCCVCVWLQNGHSNSEGFFGVCTQLGNGTLSSLPEHLLLVVLRFLGCPSPSPSLLPLFSLCIHCKQGIRCTSVRSCLFIYHTHRSLQGSKQQPKRWKFERLPFERIQSQRRSYCLNDTHQDTHQHAKITKQTDSHWSYLIRALQIGFISLAYLFLLVVNILLLLRFEVSCIMLIHTSCHYIIGYTIYYFIVHI
jgi:hypothetical protein